MGPVAPGEGAVTVPLADLLAWLPRVRREPDPRQGDLFHDASGETSGGPRPAPTLPEWIARGISTESAELDARREWGLRRRLRWVLSRRR